MGRSLYRIGEAGRRRKGAVEKKDDRQGRATKNGRAKQGGAEQGRL
jgi:hypothetical protein